MSRKKIFAALVSGVLLGAACSDQQEGERCDTNNGSEDCASGLVCTAKSQLAAIPGESTQQQSGQNTTLGLCCPPKGSTVITQPACYPNTTPAGTGGSPGSGGSDSGAAADSASGTGGSATGGASGTDGSATGGSVSTGGRAPADAASEGRG